MGVRRRVVGLAAVLLLVAPAPAAASAHGGPGSVRIPGLHGPASVVRTSDGIAHLSATNEADLAFLQGWVHSGDRLFQMDFLRRVASGTLAELLGPGALGNDVQLRTIGLRRAAERSWQAASPRLRALLSSYTDGVNSWVARNRLPREYAALELTSFARWDPVDSLVIGKLQSFNLSFDLDIENTVALQSYLAAGAAGGFDGSALFFSDMRPFAPFSSASTVPDASQPGGSAAVTATSASGADLPDLTEAARLAARYRDIAARVPLLAQALQRDTTSTGSNEWVISGRHTKDGRPILANDPHLGLSQPSIFYPMHLRRPGLDVAGEGFVGSPGVVLGQNRWIMWGATTNPMDVTDTYLEAVRPDPSSPSGLSTVHGGRLEHVEAIPETFRVNSVGDGRPDSVAPVPPGNGVPAATLIVPRRNNGPILQLDQAAGTALSVQYTGFSGTQEFETFLRWNEARNLDDFRDGLRFFDVGSQNWAYADRSGNVAYFTSAEMPLREDLQAGRVTGVPPFFVRNGQGGNEWLPAGQRPADQATPYQVLPAAEMPHVVNPAAGWFVNANNDPAGTTLDNDPLNQARPGGGIFYLNPGYDGFRGGRITQMVRQAVAGGHKVDARDVAAMQADTTLLDAQVFVPRIGAAWTRAQGSATPALRELAGDPRLAEAVRRLGSWDFTTPTGIAEGYDAADRDGRLSPPSARERDNSVAATIYSVWRSRFIVSTVDAAVAPFRLPTPSDDQALGALRSVVEGRAWTSGLDPFPVAGVPDPADRQAVAVLRALRAGLDRLAGPDFAPAFGGSTDQADYRWGRLHRVVIDHEIGGPFSTPPAFGRFPQPLAGLPGIPVDGGFNTVDAAGHNGRADSVNGFMFGSGPARRYVGVGERSGPVGRSALPGGTSGDPGSRHYLDLLRPYLTDDSYPVRVDPRDVLRAAESVAFFLPARR